MKFRKAALIDNAGDVACVVRLLLSVVITIGIIKEAPPHGFRQPTVHCSLQVEIRHAGLVKEAAAAFMTFVSVVFSDVSGFSHPTVVTVFVIEVAPPSADDGCWLLLAAGIFMLVLSIEQLNEGYRLERVYQTVSASLIFVWIFGKSLGTAYVISSCNNSLIGLTAIRAASCQGTHFLSLYQ